LHYAGSQSVSRFLAGQTRWIAAWRGVLRQGIDDVREFK
jgi:hypothetical protein